jgi:peptide/nickel transport system substrate-binding protein
MKKFIAVSLVVCMVLALAACNSSNSGSDSSDSSSNSSPSASGNEGASAKDTLTIAVTQDFGTLDFIHEAGRGDFKAASRMYAEPLYDIINTAGDKEWLLATGLDMTTPTQWVFHLRQGVKFSNGNTFDAKDVMFTLNLANNTEGQYPYFPALDYEKCKIIDDYTVELNFKSYDFSYLTNFTLLQMLDAESYDPTSYATKPIGTGPYVVTDYVTNSHLYMTANENYWGDKAKIKNLQFKVLNEETQRINALETDSVDVASVPSQDFDYVKSLSAYTLNTKPSCNSSAIWFNVTTLFKDVNARMAICYAIDRQSIVKLAYNGQATVSTWPNAMSALDFETRDANLNDSYSKGYDPVLAKQYAEKAGLVGKEIRIATNGAADYVAMAEVIQQNLIDIGIKCVINNYDEATYNALTLDPTMYDLYLRDVQAPTNTAAQNYSGWIPVLPQLSSYEWLGDNGARFKELNSSIMSIVNTTERSDAIYEMTKMFVDAPAWYSICEANKATAINKDLSGIEYVPYGHTYYNKWYWVS